MSVGRLTPAPERSRANWALAAAVALLALVILASALVIGLTPAVPRPDFDPPPWHRFDQRLSSVEQSMLMLERRLNALEALPRRTPTGSPTGSPVGSPGGERG